MVLRPTCIIQTGALIGDSDTILELYAPDCVVLFAENDDYDGSLWSRIERPARKEGEFSTGSC